MIKEIFDNYTIDENGNVFSKRKGIYLHQYEDKDGYMYISIKGKKHKIHRLVGEKYVKNVGNKPCIDHIDRNRKNNNYKNLRWVTPKENSNNVGTIERLKELGRVYKALYGKRVIDSEGNAYESIKRASEINGIKRSTLQYYLKNKQKGWRYE